MNNCRNHIFPNYLAKVEIQPINTNEYTCIHMFYFLLNLIHIKKDIKDYTSAYHNHRNVQSISSELIYCY